MRLSVVVEWVAIISALIVAAGVIGAAFRTSGNARALENYKSLAESYQLKSEEADKQIAELHSQMAEKDRQIADLSGKIGTLTELVTGRVALEELTAAVRHTNLEVTAMSKTLDAIAVKLG